MKRVGRVAGAFARTFRDAILAMLIAALLATLLGQLLNDRVALLVPLMYLPVPLIASAVLLFDLVRRGRTVRGPRFAVSIVAIVSLGLQFPHLFGTGRFDTPDPAAPSVRILEWNVMWGGNFVDPYRWDHIAEKVRHREADVIVLTETPMAEQLVQDLRQSLGESWTMVGHGRYDPRQGYITRMRVLSRFETKVEYEERCPDGSLAVVWVGAPTPFRMMIVDGISGPDDKTPLLSFFAKALREDQAIDVVAGDFNAISRSRGFSAIRDVGFREANAHDLTWRGTWPTFCPIYDIDHVFVASAHRVLNCRSFQGPGSDHRGQFVDLQIVR